MISEKISGYIGLTLTTVIGLCLRLYGINSTQLWFDEAYTGIMAQLSWTEIQQSLYFDVHPPFYIFLVKLITQFTGVSDFSLRMISVVIGTLLVPLSFILYKSLFRDENGEHKFSPYIFSFLIAINPFFIAYSQEARSYILATFLYVTTLILFLRAKRISDYQLNIYWFMYAFMASLLFLTHYISFLGFLCIGIFDLLIHEKSKYIKNLLRKLLLYARIFLPPGLIVFVYSVSILSVQYENAPEQWWIPFVTLEKLSESIYAFFFGVSAKMVGVPTYLNNLLSIDPKNLGFIILFLFTSALGYIIAKSNSATRYKIFFILSASIIPIILAILLQNIELRLFVERYLAQYSIGLILLTVFILSKINKWIGIGILLFYTANTGFITYQNNTKNNPKEIIEIAKAHSEIENNQALVIFDHPLDYTVAKYYFALDGKKDLVKLDSIGTMDQKYVEWDLIKDTDLLKNYADLKGQQRIFVYSEDENVRDVWFRSNYNIGKYKILSTIGRAANSILK